MPNNNAFIGLGSNIEQPALQLQTALQAIAQLPDTTLLKCSHFYASTPMGPQDQPDFVNAVCQVSTQLCPDSLLSHLQAIENQQGRKRNTERWGPRSLDLDILLIDQLSIRQDHLVIPHYGLYDREFVLVPLFEIAPDLTLPNGESIAQAVAKCNLVGLYRLSDKPMFSETARTEELG